MLSGGSETEDPLACVIGGTSAPARPLRQQQGDKTHEFASLHRFSDYTQLAMWRLSAELGSVLLTHSARVILWYLRHFRDHPCWKLGRQMILHFCSARQIRRAYVFFVAKRQLILTGFAMIWHKRYKRGFKLTEKEIAYMKDSSLEPLWYTLRHKLYTNSSIEMIIMRLYWERRRMYKAERDKWNERALLAIQQSKGNNTSGSSTQTNLPTVQPFETSLIQMKDQALFGAVEPKFILKVNSFFNVPSAARQLWFDEWNHALAALRIGKTENMHKMFVQDIIDAWLIVGRKKDRTTSKAELDTGRRRSSSAGGSPRKLSDSFPAVPLMAIHEHDPAFPSSPEASRKVSVHFSSTVSQPSISSKAHGSSRTSIAAVSPRSLLSPSSSSPMIIQIDDLDERTPKMALRLPLKTAISVSELGFSSPSSHPQRGETLSPTFSLPKPFIHASPSGVTPRSHRSSTSNGGLSPVAGGSSQRKTSIFPSARNSSRSSARSVSPSAMSKKTFENSTEDTAEHRKTVFSPVFKRLSHHQAFSVFDVPASRLPERPLASLAPSSLDPVSSRASAREGTPMVSSRRVLPKLSDRKLMALLN